MKQTVWSDWNATLEIASSADPSDDVVSFASRSAGRDVALEPTLVHQPLGVLAVATSAGIKHAGTLDLAVVRWQERAEAVGIFTKSLCPGAAVVHDRRVLADGHAQLLAVVSKNANVFSPTSDDDTRTLARWLGAEFGADPNDVVISCTGVIGVPLPMDRLERAISGLSRRLRPQALDEPARAILTTDRGPKVCSVRIGDLVVCAMAKGAGMIEPNMATMLVYFFTNADMDAASLKAVLVEAADRTFHAISVDSDTSTSDSLMLFSTRQVPLDAVLRADFVDAVRCMSLKLARDIVAQSEGSTKLIECTVHVDTCAEDAKILAKKVINSPLVKTAIHGGDPNWGRIVAAIGKPDVRMQIESIPRTELVIEVMGDVVFHRCETVTANLDALAQRIKSSTRVPISVRIGDGHYSAKVWGCDLGPGYVEINSAYMT
ncbi:MAG: bifunctional glutamate N-acetyltransferase/amino-acid acetyltransferase ArgJ [Polyangiaceae bacterium]|jgi:glutamate N-acetyltransferase/amino-acid N-acetyltransferase